MKYIFTLLISVVEFYACGQTTYYVDQTNGDDSFNGTAPSTAFESVDFAAGLLMSGDTLSIIGEYKNPSFDENFTYTTAHDPHVWHAENTLRLNEVHGSAGNYITIRAYDQNTLLKGDGSNIFRVTNCSFLRIEDFRIIGQVESIPLSTANALQFVYIDENTVGDPLAPTASEIRYRDEDCVSNCTPGAVVDGEIYSNLSSLSVARPSYIDTRGMYLSNVHHIDILNNSISNMPGGGLRVSDCEDINIIGNEIFACSRKSYSGTHALVVTKATSTRTTDDYRISILRNLIHHNYNEQYSWAPTKTVITPHIDEGKGISLQRNQTTYDSGGNINVNWEHGRILVANNICYLNGFSGVHSNDGNRIDFINNTCYFNSYTKSITEAVSSDNGGNIGISAQDGSDIRILNNISIIDSMLSKSAISSNLTAAEGLVVDNNIIYGTSLAGATGSINENAAIVAVQTNAQMTDPLFIAPTTFDFSLQFNSPAIDVVGLTNAPSVDFFGNTRDANPDIGAVEFIPNTSGLISLEKTVIVYPNPTESTVFIGGMNVNSQTVLVFNLLGQNVTGQTYLKGNLLDLSFLSVGTYFLYVGNQTTLIHKQ